MNSKSSHLDIGKVLIFPKWYLTNIYCKIVSLYSLLCVVKTLCNVYRVWIWIWFIYFLCLEGLCTKFDFKVLFLIVFKKLTYIQTGRIQIQSNNVKHHRIFSFIYFDPSLDRKNPFHWWCRNNNLHNLEDILQPIRVTFTSGNYHQPIPPHCSCHCNIVLL